MKEKLNDRKSIAQRSQRRHKGTQRYSLCNSIYSFVFLCAIGFPTLLSSCDHKQSSHNHDTYTCPMHPTVISDKPGACPVCGMELVRKVKPGEEIEITEDLAQLIKSPNEIVVASISTIKGQYQSMPVSLEAQGLVTYDTRLIQSIAARTGGRLEKLFLKYDFQPVSKGQKIAEIYSPELINAQRELIFLLEHDGENKTLIAATQEKLKLLGMSPSQISDLGQTKEAKNTTALYSPYSGYLVNNLQMSSSATAPVAKETMNTGMETTPVSGSPDERSGNILREGNYITTGQTLFTIVNTEAYRVEFDLPAASFANIKKGDKLKVDFGNGTAEQTSVDFVQPFFTTNKEFIKVRIITKNTEGLHIGHFVHAHVHLSSVESLWIPREAVLDLGDDKIIFVKDRNVFKPRKVNTGSISEDQIEIKSGLTSSEEIARDAHYLIDSESFIKSTK